MQIALQISHGWEDYHLLDTGKGQRLERLGPYTLIRPDPQIIWRPTRETDVWQQADAVFEKTSADKGRWVTKRPLPDRWQVCYKNLRLWAKLTPFKHTGIFPEQATHWDWLQALIQRAHRPVHILNLFGYTGGTTLACAQAGAKVTHLDASKPSITWARENQALSELTDKPIRWMLDDALKFTQREIRRGVRYDGILLDPPVYGHGPKGEVWQFNRHLPLLLKQCQQLLSSHPLCVLINAYAISSSALMLREVLTDYFGSLNGRLTVGELGLSQAGSQRLLSTGIFGRWESG